MTELQETLKSINWVGAIISLIFNTITMDPISAIPDIITIITDAPEIDDNKAIKGIKKIENRLNEYIPNNVIDNINIRRIRRIISTFHRSFNDLVVMRLLFK